MTGQTESRTSLDRLFFFGRPFSPLYGFLMSLRENLYRKGVLRQHKLEVPVISVGNLVLGGTGKTPLVLYIAKLLQSQNRAPVILSRGYKGSATGAINLVSDRTTILLDASAAGDEPRLLAEKLPGVPVITGKKRYTTGRFALDSLGADTLILDDGFQHLALKRDLDLVLFTGRDILGNGRVLPGGELREPLSALKRADAFIITSYDGDRDRKAQEFISNLMELYPEKPLFTTSYEPGKTLLRIFNGKNEIISQADARSINLYGFCGVARPDSFRKTLEKTGIKLAGFQAYDDHHAYSRAEIDSLLHKAKGSGAGGLITTEKDWVKLQHIFPPGFPLLVLPVELLFNDDFDRFLITQLNNVKHPQ
jgi:tetraacyldisaccharide 4'-kinase